MLARITSWKCYRELFNPQSAHAQTRKRRNVRSRRCRAEPTGTRATVRRPRTATEDGGSGDATSRSRGEMRAYMEKGVA